MTTKLEQLLEQKEFSKQEICYLLQLKGEDEIVLFKKSEQIKNNNVGSEVYLRGLIEMSNVCIKNCLYCGIRKDNKSVERYTTSKEEVVEAALFAYKQKYASIVIQAGERQDITFCSIISETIKEIKQKTNNELGITISLGEQSKETYQEWFDAGAHRYLLRIETSKKALYNKIHPNNELHAFNTRLKCLNDLQSIGYQTGTGVMIGLPFQKYEDMAEDLLFMKNIDIDMLGMGPYLEHSQTPLYKYRDELLSKDERFKLTLKMIAIMRIMMPKINIASATSLQAIDPLGREKALKIGANIIMPNISPSVQRGNYLLYENKPCTDEGAQDCSNCMEARINIAGGSIGYNKWGDSIHFKEKNK